VAVASAAALSTLYEFLGSNETYRKMISLKNRVVRLTYSDEFYMDILPAYTDFSSGGTCILALNFSGLTVE